MIERTKAAIHKENHRKQLQACSTSATVSGHPRVRSRSNSFVGESAVVWILVISGEDTEVRFKGAGAGLICISVQ